MITERFDLPGPGDVDVSAAAGSVVVEPGSPGQVEVEVDTAREDEWRVWQTGSSIKVHHERGGWMSRGGRADVRIRVPAGTDVSIGAASADVRSRAELGRATISTASGDVWIADAAEVSVTTASGDIRTDRVSGALSVKSASGDVRAGEVGGDATIKTASGSTSIGTASGALAASSASGDIRVNRYLGDDLELTSMSADIQFGLPPGPVRLQATSLSGEVRLPKARRGSDTERPPRQARVKTVSGDIDVRRLDD